MFINILSFIKALTLDCRCFFFSSSKPTVPTVKRIIVHFYDNSQANKVELFKFMIIELPLLLHEIFAQCSFPDFYVGIFLDT